MKSRRMLMLASLGTCAAQLYAGGAGAQDPARVMPRAYRVVFENDEVRVVDFVGRPGMGICGEGLHSHPRGLAIAMSDYQMLVSTPDTAAKPGRRKAGDVSWREPVTHKVENSGKTNARVLIIELKTPARAKS